MSTIREILRVLFAGGMSYRQIGCVIGTSHNTISRYDRLKSKKASPSNRLMAWTTTPWTLVSMHALCRATRVDHCRISRQCTTT